MANKIYNLAFDLGASSGRLMLSEFDGNKINIKQLHRFTNEPVWVNGILYWDFLKLFLEMKKGLRKAAKLNIDISGIAIDTWGVDYGLIDKNGQLLANPICYRDNRTEDIINEVNKIINYKDLYKITGIQFLNFNTIYQLYADLKNRKHLIDNIDSILFMPDLLSYFLCGEKYCEYTMASTSALLDANTKEISQQILNAIGINKKFFNRLVMPGTVVGKLKEDIKEETELPDIKVIAVGGHDTASAVCAAPLSDENSVYLSCGTWSLMGIESDNPIINSKSLQYNWTNEGGVENKIRFLKNITGLWIIQQLKKKWSETNNNLSFEDIILSAKQANNKTFTIDPDDSTFTAPINMVEAVVNYCEETGQGTPKTMGEVAMAAYNGITNKYKETVINAEKITGKKIETINMVGGGIQDEFLCQMTANKTRKKVVAGPIEASVLGNILMQLKAINKIKSLEECRKIIRNSFDMKQYTPQ